MDDSCCSADCVIFDKDDCRDNFPDGFDEGEVCNIDFEDFLVAKGGEAGVDVFEEEVVCDFSVEFGCDDFCAEIESDDFGVDCDDFGAEFNWELEFFVLIGIPLGDIGFVISVEVVVESASLSEKFVLVESVLLVVVIVVIVVDVVVVLIEDATGPAFIEENNELTLSLLKNDCRASFAEFLRFHDPDFLRIFFVVELTFSLKDSPTSTPRDVIIISHSGGNFRVSTVPQ